ncbi:hypothetical protein GCM10010329_28120 [Streptomyces spiroverticillatus]|uniref:Uncharacterized protein n=1 Tax=Streptomyces finlayi TaxID=67296 RepID=A0A918WVI8_9ACTN|nr:DUF6507 family protein [Streptomyces finlayi]GHA03962.1 hypothetical protein GCM10010329_28120 [Streptomyces spiroverticillatus]GHC88093.1 hypothetical protein GCM10010334_20530 [Streptomyces finlayi]
MTAWDIKPSGVQTVLENTRKAAESMGRTSVAIGTAMEEAGQAAGTVREDALPGEKAAPGQQAASGLVASGLNEFMAKRQKDFFYLALRSQDSIAGALQATQAYNQGQLQMAATKQREAFDDPDVQAALDKARKDAAK